MLEEFYTVDSHSECANDNTPAFKNISNYVLVDVGKKDTVKLVTRKKILLPSVYLQWSMNFVLELLNAHKLQELFTNYSTKVFHVCQYARALYILCKKVNASANTCDLATLYGAGQWRGTNRIL